MTYSEGTQFGNSEQIHFFGSADPVVSDGQLLIEIQSAGINFSDIMARLGVYPTIPRPPFRPGFEVAGRVKSIGKGVQGFSVGDGVAAMMLAGGGYATHAVVDANTAIKLPPGLDFDLAAGLMVQGLTAYLLLKEAAAGKDDTVLISAAAGGVGSLAPVRDERSTNGICRPRSVRRTSPGKECHASWLHAAKQLSARSARPRGPVRVGR